MRCKNCGTENDDNRYICENCGSPLYDEDEISAENTQQDNAAAVQADDDEAQKAVKKNAVIIAVLAVILIAVIISIIVVARGSKDDKTTTADTGTSISTTVKNSTTERTTKEETTEEKTTESTTKEETTTTTQAPTFKITAGTKVGGSVEGGGTFKKGETVVLKATAEDGYEFAGWYSDGVLKSSAATYKFEATADGSYTAVFNPAPTDVEQYGDAD